MRGRASLRDVTRWAYVPLAGLFPGKERDMKESEYVVSEALPALVIPHRVEPSPSLRTKLERRGPAALTTTELLTLIAGAGASRALQALLRRHGLVGFARLDLDALRATAGLGPAGSGRIAAALELHRRLVREGSRDRSKVNGPGDAFRAVRDLGRVRREHLVGLYLDAQNGLLRRETISIGSLNTTRSHPREILYPAVVHVALGFILAHNHPSGCVDPSAEDVEFTRAVQRAGELMGIELYDHLVVAGDGYTSMRERGLL